MLSAGCDPPASPKAILLEARGPGENPPSARVSARRSPFPRLNWTFRAFYGHYYQAPPIEPHLARCCDCATENSCTFIPLHGERDEEFQFGVTMPFRGWTLDADTFRNRVGNFLDHNKIGASNIFFPLTIQQALIRAWELTLRSPRIAHRAQASSRLFQSDRLRQGHHHRRTDGLHHQSVRSAATLPARPRPAQHAEHRRRRFFPLAFLCFQQRLLRLRLHQRRKRRSPAGPTRATIYPGTPRSISRSARISANASTASVNGLNVANDRVTMTTAYLRRLSLE